MVSLLVVLLATTAAMSSSVILALGSLAKSSQKVLIYCRQGANRSPFWALLCICVVTDSPVEPVYEMLRKVRPIVYVEPHYRWPP